MSINPTIRAGDSRRPLRRALPRSGTWHFAEAHLNYIFGQKLEDATRVGQVVAGTALVLGLLAGLGSSAAAHQSLGLKFVATASILSFLAAFLLCVRTLCPAVVTCNAPLEPARVTRIGAKCLAHWLETMSDKEANRAFAIEIHAICILIVRRNRLTRWALLLLGCGITGLVFTFIVAFMFSPATNQGA